MGRVSFITLYPATSLQWVIIAEKVHTEKEHEICPWVIILQLCLIRDSVNEGCINVHWSADEPLRIVVKCVTEWASY